MCHQYYTAYLRYNTLMQVCLEHIETLGPHIKTFWFRPEKSVYYIAGQFTELYLPHQADERGMRRWFTLSSSPTEELLAITTHIQPISGSSFKQQLAALRPGATLHLADPMGDFVLPKDPGIPLLFVAAGLGITPVRSIVKWLHDKGERRRIKLLYKVSEPEDLAFIELFKNYPLDFVPIITKQSGRLTAEKIVHEIQAVEGEPLIYISGPEQMVETLYKELQTKGIHPNRLVGDYFPGYAA